MQNRFSRYIIPGISLGALLYITYRLSQKNSIGSYSFLDSLSRLLGHHPDESKEFTNPLFPSVSHTLVDNVADYLKHPAARFSDHLPVTDQDALTISWNTLQQCRKVRIQGHDVINNGFGQLESREKYIERRNHLLGFLTKNIVTKLMYSPKQIAPSVICLQEMQGDDKELQAQLSNNYCVARLNNIDDSISKSYGIEGCRLVMLHDASVMPVGVCDLSQLQLEHSERYLAVKFLELGSGEEFVVVNVHQDYSSVAIGEKPGLKNLKLLQRVFVNIPCVITGDFNTAVLLLDSEQGKVVKGVNSNLVWDEGKGCVKERLGSCDHIIMNEAYCNRLLPELRRRQEVRVVMAARVVRGIVVGDDCDSDGGLVLRGGKRFK